jgi:hypothetical protein
VTDGSQAARTSASVAASSAATFGLHLQPIIAHQVLRCQRRPKAFAHPPAVLPPYQPQHVPSKLRLVRAMRWSSDCQRHEGDERQRSGNCQERDGAPQGEGMQSAAGTKPIASKLGESSSVA